MNKKLLQITTGFLGIVPLVTGVLSMLGVKDPVYASAGIAAFPLLDSNLRFFGGVWRGLGIALLWLIPSIDPAGTDIMNRAGRHAPIAAVKTPPKQSLDGAPSRSQTSTAGRHTPDPDQT
jgi:hypothetical protein